MKILHIGFSVPALCKAIHNSCDEYMFFDWTGYTAIPNNIQTLHNKTLELGESFNPDLTILHVQAPGVYTNNIISKIPGLVFNWTWDFNPNLEWALDIAKAHNVITGFTNEEHVSILKQQGFKAEFIQSGFNDEVFRPDGNIGREYPQIVFMGNNYPKEDYDFPLADYRIKMVDRLSSKYGGKFGVYGFGWGNDMRNFMYREAKEAECYRSAKVAINVSHFDALRYTSDRMLRLMGSGALCLSKWYPGIELDFSDKINIRVWHDLDELDALIDYYLDDNNKDERIRISQAGCELVHRNYTWKHMADKIKNLVTNDSYVRR